MGKLTNADRLKEDGTCSFCGEVQPLINVNCEKCGKRLPLPRPRFSDELGPIASFLYAVFLTFIVYGMLPILIILSGDEALLWIALPSFIILALAATFSDAPGYDDLGTALDTPDYTAAGSNFNSHSDSVMTAMLLVIPFHAARRAWARFFMAISDD